MTTETMNIYDAQGECLGTIGIDELPCLIRLRKLRGPLGCVWVYDLYGPTGEPLARGIESHADARRIACHYGYVPIETWTEGKS